MSECPPHLLRLLEAIAHDHTAVAYHPDDPHRELIEAGAAEVGLACVPDPNMDFRRIGGCTAPAGSQAQAPLCPPERNVDLAEPPPGIPVRTEWGGVIWQRGLDEWVGMAPNGTRPSASWEALSGGKFGPVEILIPVPAHVAHGDDGEQLSNMLDEFLRPIIDGFEQLGAAAASGFRVLLDDALRRGAYRSLDEDIRTAETVKQTLIQLGITKPLDDAA